MLIQKGLVYDPKQDYAILAGGTAHRKSSTFNCLLKSGSLLRSFFGAKSIADSNLSIELDINTTP